MNRRKPWWSCVCGPSIVLLYKLVIYCDLTWYNVHTYIRAELIYTRKQKTAFRPYSFFANVKKPQSDKEVYLLNQLFDERKSLCCVMHDDGQWLVWNFSYKPPYIKDNDLNIANIFPVFAHVYRVKVTQFGYQRFLKCDCLHYERCGLPCSHTLRIINVVEETMIEIQHLKVYQVHHDHGTPNCDISSKLMQGTSLQMNFEEMGMPILEETLKKALNPSVTM